MTELVEILEGPHVVYAYSVMDSRERKVFRAPPGLSIRELRPKVSTPVLVVWNGAYVLSEDEDYIPHEDDFLIFFHVPLGGGNVSQQILGVVLIVAGVALDFFTAGTLGNAFIAAGFGILVSGLVPVPKLPNTPLQSSLSASPTYNIQLAGNSARIGQSIPVVYGRHILLPDFASQPYIEYDSSGNQYYFAIMCLGQRRDGKYTIETLQIDDTDLSHFVDVQYKIGSQFRSPDDDFVGPTLIPQGIVNPAVVTNTAVANNVMVYGTIIGPFVACGPSLQVNRIGIDVACPKGLYFAADDGSLQPVTLTWRVEARTVDDYNLPTGVWTLLGSESLTAANSTPIRRSYKYSVTAGRYEVRAQRLEAENTDARYGDEIQWTGLRAYLNMAVPMEPSAMYLQLKIRADSQLSGLSQRQVSVIIQRWLPTWNPDTGWGADIYTRSPAWEAVDVLRSDDYGGRVDDSRIDLQSYYELSLTNDLRGDTCNLVFDSRVVTWQALQTILATCRARPLMRGSVFTVVRDEQQTLPVALFNMRNIRNGSFKMSFNMVSEDTVDGIELQFFNEQSWASDYVRFPLPGFDESVNPSSISILGITSKLQAQRETLYMVSDAAYRRTNISFDTELEGYLPAFGDLIAVAHDVPGWGMSGEFAQWDGTTAICTEDLTWAPGPNYVLLINDQGDPQGPYLVTAGPVARSMILPTSIDDDLIYTGTDHERTRYAFGPSSLFATNCRITGITPGADNVVTITAAVEDNRVHTADNAYLPSTAGGTLPGSGGGGTGTIPGGGRVGKYSAGGLPVYDAASDAQRAANGFYSDVDHTVGTSHDPGYVYVN